MGVGGGDDLPLGLDGPGSWRAPSRASRILLGPCGGVAHRRGASPRTDSGFSARFRGFPGTSAFSGWAPMCRGARSAHGRIPTALSTEAFPHDSADYPPTGPDRMCSTTRVVPIPHIRAWRHRPNTPDPTPTSPRPSRHRAAPGRPRDLSGEKDSLRRMGRVGPPRAGACPNLPQRSCGTSLTAS